MMEKKITLAVAKEVGRLLSQQVPDVQVVYTRESDTYPTLAARAELANRRGAELFLSIHVNEAPSCAACGTETFIATTAATKGANANKSEMLALLMQKHYLKRGMGTSRGVKRRELYVIEQTRMPSVLTEIGFLSNSADSAVMCTPAGQTLVAQAIVDALKEWKQIARPGVKRRDLINLRYAYQDYRVEDVQPLPAAVQTTPVAAAQTAVVEPEAAASATQTAAADAMPEPSGDVPGTPLASANDSTATAPPATDELPALCFAIQLMNSSKALLPTDSRLKGVTPTRCIKVGTLHKVIAHVATSYDEARSHLAAVRELFPDAFIVAFHDGIQITVSEAKQLQQ